MNALLLTFCADLVMSVALARGGGWKSFLVCVLDQLKDRPNFDDYNDEPPDQALLVVRFEG